MKRSWVICWTAMLAVLVFSTGCDRSWTAPANVQGQNYLLEAEQFDLGTVIALIRDGRVGGADLLEKRINDPESGINYVDIDRDGQIDYVAVRGATQLEFLAFPSSHGPAAEPTVIASVNIVREAGNLVVSGGYPNYVRGYDAYYYHMAVPYAANPFVTWWLTPGRSMYYRPAFDTYHPRAVVPIDTVRTVRERVQTTTHVSPVRHQSRPEATSTPRATQVKSRMADQAPKTGPSGLRNFEKRDEKKPKAAATGFGGPQKTTQPATRRSGSGWGTSSGNGGGFSGTGSGGFQKPSQPSNTFKPSQPARPAGGGWGTSSGNQKGWGSGSGSGSGSKPSKGSGWGTSSGNKKGWGSPGSKQGN